MNQCASSGCRQVVVAKRAQDPRDPRRSSYGPSSPYEIPSRFCEKHTCAYFWKASGCTAKKAHHDSVCPMHTKCPISGCNLGRLQVLDEESDEATPQYIRYELCGEHKCSFPNCPEEKAQQDGRNGFLPFCKKHRCQFPLCDQRKLEGRSYCLKHKCKVESCQTVMEDGFTLCALHIVCDIPGCKTAKALDSNGKDYLKWCALHIKCETPGCSANKSVGSKHCVKHTCPERNCYKTTEKYRYCEDHRCKFKDCDHPRGWVTNTARGLYCPMHTCRTEDCNDPVDEYNLYCENHACSDSKCRHEAVWEQRCGEHLKLFYETAAIAKAKSESEDLSRQLMARDMQFRDEMQRMRDQFEEEKARLAVRTRSPG